MALQNLVGAGIWLPPLIGGYTNSMDFASSDSALLDADEEEFQVIGRVRIDGITSKTFGTSGSKIGWLPGAAITFASGSTLRVGVKKSTTIDATAGPAARATIGAAAFDVYDDLVGGTDTITSTTWREDAMSAGTPYTVANGDLIAVCFHLDTTSGSPSVKIRNSSLVVTTRFPACTLVTSGPTYTALALLANLILIFDDGTLGWIEPSSSLSVPSATTANIGNTNIIGNIFQVPFSCTVDAIAATFAPGGDFALELYSTPLGTPALIESVACDANILAAATNGLVIAPLVTPRTLTINTDYAVGIQQTSATNITSRQVDVSTAAYFKSWGMGAECYAANSTAGGTFAAQNSGKRRYEIAVRISALDDGVSAGGGGLIRHPGMSGGLNG